MLTLLLRVFLALFLLADQVRAAGINDVRVLIDSSGSMKKTDPRNLRIPALKLLIHLLPNGSRAGVWLFDAAPQVLIPPGNVDSAWKSRALAAADKIHSRGQFTHIEAALNEAGADWLGTAAEENHRCVILFTDGMVDVPRKPEENMASRERILTTLLPGLQMAGVKIHTIALSSDSDQELLRQLSLASDGWNEIAENAEALQGSFAQMLDKAAPRESLPLVDNRFEVDAGIEEFTLLAMLRPGAQPSQLAGPDGRSFGQEHPPKYAHWVHETGYDLITVEHPAPGEWRLQAESDPANRVLIVTHLKLEVTPFPNFVSLEELPVIEAGFSENGQRIEREEFLRVLDMKARLSGAGDPLQLPIPRDLVQPTLFTLHLEPAPRPGAYSLTVTADGKTFQRQSTQTFQVMDALVAVTSEVHPEAETPHQLIALKPSNALLADSLVVQANLTGSGSESSGELPVVRQEGLWLFRIPLPEPGQRRIVNFSATARTTDGKDITIPLKPIRLDGGEMAAPPPEGAAPTGPHPEAPPAVDHVEPAWWLTLLEAAGINLVVALGGWLVYRGIRRRNEASIARLLDKLAS